MSVSADWIIKQRLNILKIIITTKNNSNKLTCYIGVCVCLCLYMCVYVCVNEEYITNRLTRKNNSFTCNKTILSITC